MELDEAICRLIGTSASGIELAEELGIELDELERHMADSGYDRCVLCDWWYEACELSKDCLCESCGGGMQH